MESVEVVIPWTNFILSFMATWGALIISALSLVVAIISIVKSSKNQRLQNKVNEIEIKLKEYELDKINKVKQTASSAVVQARIIHMGKNNYRLKIWNSGGETAYNVTVKFEEKSQIIVLEQDKLPYEELETMKSFELPLILSFDSFCKARVRTEWDDANGFHQSKSQLVDY